MIKTLFIIALLLAGLYMAVLWYGGLRWETGTRQLRMRLEAARMPLDTPIVAFSELEGLPAPVQRYFRMALRDGQPLVIRVHVHHKGTFNLSETTDKWKPFTSDQLVVTRRPGFDWDGRIRMMPGVVIRVHDAYVAGEGVLHAAVLGLLSVVDLHDTREVAEGELMRFFAEAAWYPTALLPSQDVRWEAVDARSARATLVDGSMTSTMLFRFNEEGVIETVRAEARGRTVGNQIIPTPWEGSFSNYQQRGDMYVPLDGEVAWVLPDGARPYWRGRIMEIAYEFAH